MALDIGGAAGGAIGLQDLLQQRFREALANQQAQQEQQKIAIEQQRVNNESDLKRMQLQESAARNADAIRARAITEGATHGANTPIGTNVINDPMLPQMRAAGLPITDVAPTLSSRNLTGGAVAQGPQAPPRIVGLAPSGTAMEGLASTQNPGHGPKAVYGGTDKQQEAATREAATNRFATSHPQYKDAIIAAGPEGAKTLVGDFTREEMAANKPPAESEAAMKARALDIGTRQERGQPVSADEVSWLHQYKQNQIAVPTATFNMNAPDKSSARLDRSYQLSATQLDKLRTPVEQTAEKVSSLEDLLGSNPMGESLVAPKLLSTFVGGQGSGLRMTQAELDKVAGGAGKWQSLRSAMQQWDTDAKSASSLTPEQRTQVRQLVDTLKAKTAQRLKVLDDAGNALLDAQSPNEHRRIVNGVHQDMTNISTGSGTTGTQTPPATVKDPLGIR